MAASADSEWVTRAVAMSVLGISYSTIQRREESGELTPYRSGRIVRYRKTELDALLQPRGPMTYVAKPKLPPLPEFISRREASRITGYSVQTLRRREGNGLTPHRDGKLVTYRLSEVLALTPEVRRAAYEAERKTQAEKTRATYAPEVPR